MSVSVETTQQINVRQLAGELGAGLVVAAAGDVTTVSTEDPAVTVEQLQAVVDAHVPADELGNAETLRERLRAALRTNRTYLGRTAPTAAQNTAQTRALTQEVDALIRLTLNLLDRTD